jgi:hypothetical protein
MNGIEKLKAAVQRDCNDKNHCGCFNENGCDKHESKIGQYGDPGYKKCFHSYCDKFKWIVDRAKHYEQKTGIPYLDIIDAWESNRTYWYENYYQEANQPEIKGDNVRVFDTVEQMKESIGDNGFRCPCCGGISTSPYECDSGIIKNNKKCDWKSYGLFGTLGKGVSVFCKDKIKGETFFMPIAWEKSEELI